MAALDELIRLCQPRELAPLVDCLEGKPSVYDRDGEWTPRDWRLRCSVEDAFDGDAFLNAVLAIPFLSSRLPVGDPLRAGLPRLDRLVRERLANPKLLLRGGAPTLTERDEDSTARSEGAWVVAMRWVSFCPARVKTPAQRDFLVRASERSFPNDLWPWSGLFPALEAFESPGYRALVTRLGNTPVPAGRYELDPGASAPELVAEASTRLGVGLESARLFLQLLTLVDCSDAVLCEANRWTKAQLKAYGAPLVAAGLLTDEKQPRSTRSLSLPGAWDAYKAPHPATERAKLWLYDASVEDGRVVAPLGRVLPLRPLHELFALAWERWCAEAATARPTPKASTEWLTAICANPADDHPREVYADWLEERGDPRGRFIHVQCQLERHPTPQLEAEARALLEEHEATWNQRVHAFFEHAHWTRGFVTAVHAHAGRFAKGASAVFETHPLLERFVFSETISAAQVRELAACPEFARFKALDTGGTNYFSRLELLQQLLDSPHCPALRWLRIAFHRPGRGAGVAVARALAGQPRFHDALEFLELQGQGLGVSVDDTFEVTHHGTEALDVLLESMHALEVLRVPLNGFTDVDARAIARRLEQGLAPGLRQLDFSNTIDEAFVTKAVLEQANQVSAEGQHRVNVVLARRVGSAAPPPPPSRKQAPGAVRPQTGRYPFAEQAKSGRSTCVVCNEKIAQGDVRIGVERRLPDVGVVTAWLHPTCRADCPELFGMTDLEERLTRNSAGAWPLRDGG